LTLIRLPQHNFVDGNNCVGLKCALLFLRVNGCRLSVDSCLPAQAVLDTVNKIMTIE
jgi:prophage maintenance system killer protein